MKQFRLGVIGAGSRGYGWMRVLAHMQNVKIVALCECNEERLYEKAKKFKDEEGVEIPFLTTDYKKLIAHEDVEVVMVFSAWRNHVDASIAAMLAGKPVATEVCGAHSIQQCWRLVETYEQTRTPFFFMENACYGEIEMTVTKMVRDGMFGEIVHCAGGYCHDLRSDMARLTKDDHYRGIEYLKRNSENYPTHEIGPIAKLLDINNGNRFLSLYSISSKAAGINAYLEDDHPMKNATFAQGDIFTTVLKCANGETITITLDTTLPRYYCRDFTVRGTKGMYEERTNSVYLDEPHRKMEADWKGNGQWDNMATTYMEQYRHPLWVEYRKNGTKGGHGGMDGLLIDAFFDALENGTPMPIDVYDAATWMAITALSEQSISINGPVPFPDFTCGMWLQKRPPVDSVYNLL